MERDVYEASARKDGLILAEGKTKIIATTEPGNISPDIVTITSKDDITAGDGGKHDLIPGKAAWATETTCNVFRLLQGCGVPVAFMQRVSPATFTAPLCRMLPYEVVVRREAHGSYLKRRPDLHKGHLFPKLIVEFFLKTKNRRWKDHELPCDDPLMGYQGGAGKVALYEPSKPIQGQTPFLLLPESEVFGYEDEWKCFAPMQKLACRAFLILEKAWHLEGRKLVDFKVEFGLAREGTLLLADVIDNDSWRVVQDGAYIDKQRYRDGGAIDDVAEHYRRVAEITGHFHLPVQQLIVWRGSEKDDVTPILATLTELSGAKPQKTSPYLEPNVVTCSMHKEPVRGLEMLHELIRQVPDTVAIACIGRSNGAGPTLSAATTVPVITCPMSFKEFPEDVWSSLRTPSQVPVMTVLEPSNAALAALQILALRNPLLYMLLREQLEERLTNSVPL